MVLPLFDDGVLLFFFFFEVLRNDKSGTSLISPTFGDFFEGIINPVCLVSATLSASECRRRTTAAPVKP